MEYIRKIDFDKLNHGIGGHRPIQWLLDRDSGAEKCSVVCIKTPPGAGSESGLHTHPFEQVFYILSGTMELEIAGGQYRAETGSVVVLPQGVPHRNWNAGSEPSMHLSFMTPLVPPGTVMATPVTN